MLYWLRRHADPDECLVILFSVFCVWRGLASWNDLVGKPRDAPHLLIEPHVRAVMWWLCAALGMAALRMARDYWLRRWSLSFVGIGFMTTFVFGSYLASWVASWKIVDLLINDDVLKGDPRAWGSMPLYFLGLVCLFAIMLAPYDWTYLDRRTYRAGRLEKHHDGGV